MPKLSSSPPSQGQAFSKRNSVSKFLETNCSLKMAKKSRNAQVQDSASLNSVVTAGATSYERLKTESRKIYLSKEQEREYNSTYSSQTKLSSHKELFYQTPAATRTSMGSRKSSQLKQATQLLLPKIQPGS